MEIIKKIINNNTYTFVCETWTTARAWGHSVTMFRNNIEYTFRQIRYYNRTWESYEYQSCMLKCVNSIIDEEKEFIFNEYKQKHNKKRLTQEQKDELTNNSKIIQELKELKKAL